MRTRFVVVALLLFLLSSIITTSAQQSLTYGRAVTGRIAPRSPLAFYTFAGLAGDRVTIQVIGLSPEFSPELTLMQGDEELGISDFDAYDSSSAMTRLSLVLGRSATYTIFLTNTSGLPGDYWLRLTGQPSAGATVLSSINTNFALDATDPMEILQFKASPDGITTLSISTQTTNFGFRAVVTDENNQFVALLVGSRTMPIALNIAPGTGGYWVEVTPLIVNSSGQLSASISIPVPEPEPTVITNTPRPVITVMTQTQDATVPATPTQRITPTIPATPTQHITPTMPATPTQRITPTIPVTPTQRMTATVPATPTQAVTPVIPVTPTPEPLNATSSP